MVKLLENLKISMLGSYFHRLKGPPNDWLLTVEIGTSPRSKRLYPTSRVLDYLDDLKQKTRDSHLISGGLDLIFRKIITL
jgi:hypothetical protein